MENKNTDQKLTFRELVSIFIFIILMFLGADHFWYKCLMKEIVARSDRSVLMARDVFGAIALNFVHEHRYQAVALVVFLIMLWIYLKINKK